MAVAQGFSKITTSGSVFMYDTADTVNCYKGEPTTNQFLAQGTAGPGSASDNNVTFPINGTGTFIRLGYGQSFGGYTIQPRDVVYKYDLGSNGCHYHGMLASIPSGVYATFTFDYYVSPGTTIETNYLANFENYGGNALGGSVSAPNSLTGVWQTVTFTSGPTVGTGTQAMFLYPGGCGPRFGDTGYILYKNAQVEWKQHSTPFVNGTRSVSGSLLPLVSNIPLDLSNVSFDANGQIEFDGTDDYINLGNVSSLGLTDGKGTVEVIVRIPSSWTGGSQYPNLVSKGATAGWDTDGWSLFVFRDWSGPKAWGFGMRNNSVPAINYIYRSSCPVDVYLHLVATIDGSNIILYENGNYITSGAQSINPASNNTNVLIGRDANALSFPGKVPVVKVYNRALSAREVLNNYHHYKTRFNLS